MKASPHDLTRLLHDWSRGAPDALDRLMPLIYDDLRRIAKSSFDHESAGNTLQATAIVHELYVRLLTQDRIHWRNRQQFFAVAATMIRRILVSHARKRQASKRGGGFVVLELDEAVEEAAGGRPVDLIALEDALTALAEFAPRQSQIIELRFFGGLTIDETADALGVSSATVSLDWNLARAWLFRELSKE
ncbi:MAG: sigma-70 family RNA polymerase sigma factor [Thermoanaerobaculia bacterium]